MFRIYDKNVIAKEIFSVNLTQEEVEIVLEGNLFKDHPELNPQDYVVIEQDYPFDYPTFKDETIKEMTIYERYQNGLYALSEREKEYQGDIITLEPGQYIDEKGILQTVPKIEGVRVEWNWELNKWEDVATELEVAELQYAEYDALDKPSVIDEMNLVDPTLGQELKNMLIELRGIISTLKEQQSMIRVGYSSIHIPEPSKKLEDFKNKFNKFKK